MRFEKLTETRVPEVAEIERLSFSDPHTAAMISSSLANPACEFWLSIEESKVAGFIEFWTMYGETHVIDIAVHPENRRRGIGASLMNLLIEKSVLSASKKIFLEVRPSNLAAIELYKKFGFQESGFRKKYYKDEDALIMTKEIGVFP